MTRSILIMLAAGGSVALLAGAFAFQYIGGLAPCVLCIWQRWPHALAIVAGFLALTIPGRIWPNLGVLATLTTAGIGMFHVGVEQKWWEGLAMCSVNTLQGVSGADLLNTDITVGGPAACDKIPWAMLGISMAGWNVIFSLILMAIWVRMTRKAWARKAWG